MGDTEQQLEFRLKELSAREGRLRELEGELSRVREELADSRAEVTGLRASMARLDHDKDLLSVSHCCFPPAVSLFCCHHIFSYAILILFYPQPNL